MPENSHHKRGRGRMRLVWLAIIGLAYLVFAWFEPDKEDLFEICRSRGMPAIYRTVTADGYFDGTVENCRGCWRYLENTDYRFIEFPIIRPPSYGPITEAGIYRASRIQAGSPECDVELTASYTKAKIIRKEFERNDWCLKLEKLDSRRARFGYYRENLGALTSSPITGSSIYGTRHYFLDHETGEVLAESTNYTLASFPRFHISSFSSGAHCNTYINQLGPRGLDRQSVILPTSEAIR